MQDLCRFIDLLLEKRPVQHIFNVGNRETISIRDWAELCYQAAGRKAEFVQVSQGIAGDRAAELFQLLQL